MPQICKCKVKFITKMFSFAEGSRRLFKFNKIQFIRKSLPLTFKLMVNFKKEKNVIIMSIIKKQFKMGASKGLQCTLDFEEIM